MLALSASRAAGRLLSSWCLAVGAGNRLGAADAGCCSGASAAGVSRDAHVQGAVGGGRRPRWRRGFMGCGDGEEAGGLSKIHEERRIIGYSPEQLFAVVAAVDLYQDFVPWCQHSRVLECYSSEAFTAELQIGFKFLVESYISQIELKKPKLIKTTVTQSSLFDHLTNVWEFGTGPVPGSCDLYFLVDFKFQSPLYRQVATLLFEEVASRLVISFTDRCRRIYGPETQVFEHSYGERV